MTVLEIFKILLFLISIGVCFFFYEGIIIMDFFSKWGKWWTKAYFESNKDRNNDGRISWWERTFPNDGGHFFKRLLVVLIGAGITCVKGVPAEYYIFCAFVGWWVISATFDIMWNIWRKKN